MSTSTPPGTPPESSSKSDSSSSSTHPTSIASTRGARLLRSTGIVSAMTMLSRVLGLARDVVVANLFGASDGADAFFVAFKIPNFFRRLFGEGAFAQAFVPVLADYREKQSPADVKRLVDSVAGTLGLVLLIVSVLAVLGAPWVVMVFAPGWVDESGGKLELAAEMLRLTFPYLFFISLTAFASSVLNSLNQFAIPAFTPVLMNVTLIGFALVLSPMMDVPIMAMAWGVLAAGIVQLGLQLPFLYRVGLLPRPRVDWKHSGVRRIMKLMLPALFAVSVAQINLLLDTVLASFLIAGSVSWLYFSDRLMELPLGVFGIAIATVILPNLSKQHAADDKETFSKMLDWAIRMVLLIGLPASVALIVLAEPLLITLFHYGAFTDADVTQSAMSLRAYGAGLLAFMLIKVLSPGYFARQDTKTPVKIGIIAMVANMVMNLILIGPLAHVGLALATSLSAFLNAFLLYVGLRRDGVFRLGRQWFVYLAQFAVANALMIAVLLWLVPDTGDWLRWGVGMRAGWMALVVAAGGGVYFVALAAVGLRVRHLRVR